MGRTGRFRRKKKGCNNPVAETAGEVIELCKFVSQKGWQNQHKLAIYKFPGTGRGIKSAHNFRAKEILIELPFDGLFISLVTVLEDLSFMELCGNINTRSIGIQLLLTAYLLFQKHLGINSKWYPYIDSLPKDLTNPHFCSITELSCVPKIKTIVISDLNNLNKSFHMNFSNSGCSDCSKSFLDFVSEDELKLMYYLVNSRSVYVDPEIVRAKCAKLQGFDIISDELNMALAPFLDFFNHSDKADTISEMVHSIDSMQYRLITKTAYKRHEQIFISYGPHSNMKLYLEYGFFIANNCHDKIDAELDDVLRFYDYAKHMDLERDNKLLFILRHKLSSEMFVSRDGASYNLGFVLFILNCNKFNEKIFVKYLYTELPNDDIAILQKKFLFYLEQRIEASVKNLERITLTHSGSILLDFLKSNLLFLTDLKNINC